MVRSRIKELMKARGVKAPLAALMKAGISQGVAQKMLNGSKKWISIAHVEKLCILLRCTPNDLYEWVPDNQAEDYPENPLQVIRQKPAFNLEEVVKNMTLEEIKKKFGG